MNPDNNRRFQSTMPSTHTVVSTGAIIAISVITATAFAVYESPEVRQFAEDLRRRIAQSLRALGDNIEPGGRRQEEDGGQPLFNRPEDAHGVLNRDVDADEASRRRQREELAYWNHLREQRLRESTIKSETVKAESDAAEGTRKRTRSSSFGDFLQQDGSAEPGTYVFKSSGVETAHTDNLVHRRLGSRGINRGAVFANPFDDEHGIELNERDGSWGEQVDLSQSLMTPSKDEIVSVTSGMESEDLYGAEDNRIRPLRRPVSMPGSAAGFPGAYRSAEPELLVDVSEVNPKPKEEEETQYATPGRYPSEQETDAYAAIHAWNDNASGSGFYSPLPTTPQVLSEVSDGDFGSASGSVVGDEHSSEEGMATPKTMDSMSIIGENERVEDVDSGSDNGRSTPGSWTEVGSDVSSEAGRIL